MDRSDALTAPVRAPSASSSSSSTLDWSEVCGSAAAATVRVSFSAQSECYFTLPLSEYTPEEVQRCWFDLDDYQDMKVRNDAAVKRMGLGKQPRTGDTYRGLEGSTRDGRRAFARNFAQAVDAVLDEQDAQWAEGHADSSNDRDERVELMAELYAGACNQCKLVALTLGLRDEREARAIASGRETKSRSKSKRRSKSNSSRSSSKNRRSRSKSKSKNKSVPDRSVPDRSVPDRSVPDRSTTERFSPEERLSPEKSDGFSPEKSSPEKSSPQKSRQQKSTKNVSAQPKAPPRPPSIEDTSVETEPETEPSQSDNFSAASNDSSLSDDLSDLPTLVPRREGFKIKRVDPPGKLERSKSIVAPLFFDR